MKDKDKLVSLCSIGMPACAHVWRNSEPSLKPTVRIDCSFCLFLVVSSAAAAIVHTVEIRAIIPIERLKRRLTSALKLDCLLCSYLVSRGSALLIDLAKNCSVDAFSVLNEAREQASLLPCKNNETNGSDAPPPPALPMPMSNLSDILPLL